MFFHQNIAIWFSSHGVSLASASEPLQKKTYRKQSFLFVEREKTSQIDPFTLSSVCLFFFLGNERLP